MEGDKRIGGDAIGERERERERWRDGRKKLGRQGGREKRGKEKKKRSVKLSLYTFRKTVTYLCLK